MVSTRRKSYAAGTAAAGQEQANGESDSNSPMTTATETPSTRRSASKSARSRASQSESDSGATPQRRSRRLSNSSVGSNDEDSDVTAAISSTKKRKSKVEEMGPSAGDQADERVQLSPIKETEEMEAAAPRKSARGEANNSIGNQKEIVPEPATSGSVTLPDEKSQMNQVKITRTKESKVHEKPKNPTVLTRPATQTVPANPVEGQKQKLEIPRGKPKSGRVWKELRTNPRTMYKDAGLKMPLEKVLQLKAEKQRVKEIQNRLNEEQRRSKEELRRRQELNRKKREENDKKGEIVQVIRNSAKLKRMKKKQLKMIQKRDTTNM